MTPASKAPVSPEPGIEIWQGDGVLTLRQSSHLPASQVWVKLNSPLHLWDITLPNHILQHSSPAPLCPNSGSGTVTILSFSAMDKVNCRFLRPIEPALSSSFYSPPSNCLLPDLQVSVPASIPLQVPGLQDGNVSTSKTESHIILPDCNVQHMLSLAAILSIKSQMFDHPTQLCPVWTLCKKG